MQQALEHRWIKYPGYNSDAVLAEALETLKVRVCAACMRACTHVCMHTRHMHFSSASGSNFWRLKPEWAESVTGQCSDELRL